MGQLKSDGRAINVTFPAGVITFGDLYRIDGWTGVALEDFASGETPRAGALEIAAERIWYVKAPAAVNGARGTLVYWTAGAGFKRADTDLTSTVTGNPVGKIEEARDANGWVGIRLVNAVDVVV
jgi:hypothetical protein